MKKRRLRQIIYEIVLAACVGILLTAAVGSFFFKLVTVQGFGMIPTLRNEDVVLVQRNTRADRFELIAFSGRNKETQVRRIIGLPGEKVVYQGDVLFVDDVPIDEKFLVDEINDSQKGGRNYTEDFSVQALFETGKIPENYYLVLGDNRPYATDSRHYGLISEEQLVGVVKMKVFSLNTTDMLQILLIHFFCVFIYVNGS